MEWFKRLNRVTQTPSSLHDLFAFAFYAWTTEIGDVDIISRLKGEIPLTCEQLFKKEVERLRLVSRINVFKFGNECHIYIFLEITSFDINSYKFIYNEYKLILKIWVKLRSHSKVLL